MPPKAKEAKGAAGKDAKGKDAKGKDAKAAGGKDAKDAGGKGPRGPRGAADAKARGRGRGDKKEDERGGFGRGFGGRRGRGRGRRARGAQEKEEWIPLTKLGRLVQAKKIRSLEEIYLFSLPIKEYQIVDHFIPSPDLKDEVMAIAPVQKQSAAGQRTRFRAFVIVGDENGHIGLGNKVAKEVATAIRGAIIDAKLHVIPVRRGYWGGRLGAPHTVPCKVQGKSGSVRFRIIPAPKGTGLVAAKVPKKVLTYAGIKDCYTSSTGQSKTLGNFVKATIGALEQTYGYLTPDLWATTVFEKSPYQEHTDFLKEYVPPPPKKKAVSSAS